MPATLATTVADLLLGLALGSGDQAASNRFSFEGLSLGANAEGALELGIRSLELTGLHGSFSLPSHVIADAPALSAAWSLGPLAAANGTIRAQIIDAHLMFDANVTVPIREGLVRFNDATVEHVGPDSHMGVSRLGIFVDAPDGRSYLYQFASTPVAGVEFEKRSGGMLGAWRADRGSLRLQEFTEGLLRQGPGGKGPCFTEQARLLLARTSLAGELRLSDGRFAAPGVQADLVGRAEGRNEIRLSSESVGHGVTAEIGSLLVRNAQLTSGDAQLHCDEITATLRLRVIFDGAQVRLEFDLAKLNVSRLRLQWRRPANSKPPTP